MRRKEKEKKKKAGEQLLAEAEALPVMTRMGMTKYLAALPAERLSLVETRMQV